MEEEGVQDDDDECGDWSSSLAGAALSSCSSSEKFSIGEYIGSGGEYGGDEGGE